MATNKISALILCYLCFWGSLAGQPVLESLPTFEETTEHRKKLVEVAASQVGVREKTGKNDGPEVRMYLREVGLSEGYPYCAAGLTWCHNQLNIPNPQSAWSPDWFKTNVVYRRNQPRMTTFVSRPGQVIGFYSESKKRVSHVALIEGESRFHYYTIEFNTNGAGSDEGQGVRRLIRQKSSAHVISDYVGYKEIKEAMKEGKK